MSDEFTLDLPPRNEKFSSITKKIADAQKAEYFFQRELYSAVQSILVETCAGVRPEDCVLLIDDKTLGRLERLPEFQKPWLRQPPFAIEPIMVREKPLPVMNCKIYGFAVKLTRSTDGARILRLHGERDDFPYAYSVEIPQPPEET